TSVLRLDWLAAYELIGVALVAGTLLIVFFGWLSDRIGRLKIIVAGCLFAAATYVPIFKALTHSVNPALEAFHSSTPISVAGDDCSVHVFVGPSAEITPCDMAHDFLLRMGLPFATHPAVAGAPVLVTIGDQEFRGWSPETARQVTAALKARGF